MELRELQLYYLEILKEVADFCDKNNIKYFLCGGTALGAVRYKGFIPWDDDLDISMPIEDYRRFCKLFPVENSRKYFIQNYHNDKEWNEMFGGVNVNGTTSMPVKWKNLGIHFGLQIDIFPVVGVYQNGLLRNLQKKLFGINRTLLGKDFDVKTNQNWVPNRKVKFLYHIPRVIRHFICDVNSIIVEKSFYHSNECCDLSVRMCKFCKTSTYGNGKMIQFEDAEFRIAEDYDTYLKSCYGSNYMTPPPEKDRMLHENLLGEIIYDPNTDYTHYQKK